jgi:hypothetical protein
MGFWNSNEGFGFSKIEVGTLIQGFESNGLNSKFGIFSKFNSNT